MSAKAPVNLDQPIPEALDPSFVLGPPILPTNPDIRSACRGGDCSYIAKVLESVPEVARTELLISELAGRLGIGPKIYAMSLNDKEGIIVMDRYDGTLDDLFYLYQDDRSIPMDQIVATVGEILRILHQNNIIHWDLRPDNIFYTKGGVIALGDYGHSLISDSEETKDEERDSYQVMLDLVKAIKGGRRFEHGEGFITLYAETMEL